VPVALSAGVMSKILSGEVSGVSAVTSAGADTGTDSTKNAVVPKKNNIVRLTLTRYLPVAACLAIMLVSLPWIINYLGRQSDYNNAAPMSAEMALTHSYDLADEDSAPRADSGAGIAPGGSADYGSAGGSTSRAGEFDAPWADQPAAEAFPAPTDASTSGAGLSGALIDGADPADIHLLIEPEDDDNMRDTGDDFDPLSQYEDAYAWIEIRGAPLSPLLTGIEPIQLGAGSEFDRFYVIPREIAQVLIEETQVWYGIEIPISTPESDYAILLYQNRTG